MAVKASYYASRYPNTHIRGFEAVMIKLQGEINKMKKKSERGLVEAALFIRHDTERTPYITPRDYGNLRASWIIVSKSGLENDPLNYSGHFKRNAKKNISIATFKMWYSDAIAEARAIVSANIERASVMFGYTANYAMYVHENMDAQFSQENSGPKWFQESMDRNQSKFIQIIRETSKVTGAR